MFELSSAVTVLAPSHAVWRVITDFPRYRAWTKVVLIDGEPRVNEALNYQIAAHMKSGTRRAIRFEGKVRVAKASSDLVWTTGVPGILGLRFGFALQPSGAATEFRHYLQVSGLAAHLARGRLSRLYGPILDAVTHDLAKHFTKTRLATLRVAPDIRRRKLKPKPEPKR